MREGQGSHRQTPWNWEVPGLQRSPKPPAAALWIASRSMPGGHSQPHACPGQFIEGGLSFLWSRKSCVSDSIARNLLKTVLARKVGNYRPQGSQLAAEERGVMWGCCSPGQARGPAPFSACFPVHSAKWPLLFPRPHLAGTRRSWATVSREVGKGHKNRKVLEAFYNM